MSPAVELTPAVLREQALPTVTGDSDKEARGRVLVVGGGSEVPGAVMLAAIAALRSGAGKLQIAAPRRLQAILGLAVPEARVFGLPETADGELAAEAADRLAQTVERCGAVVIGPGMLDERGAGALTLRLLEGGHGAGFVVDAGAMTGLADQLDRLKAIDARIVLTPHAGEMAALTGQSREAVEAQPEAAARAAAERLGSVVALKGETTFIAAPDGGLWRHADGVVGLATSGSGDVLAGIIGGLLARGAAPAQAALWGVYVHGQAGVRLSRKVAPLGFLAREILDEIAPVLAGLGPSTA